MRFFNLFLAASLAAAVTFGVACDDGGPVDPPVDCSDPGKADSFECADSDGDGVPYANDNCPEVANPATVWDDLRQAYVQADADGDGLGDACDDDSGCQPGPVNAESFGLVDLGSYSRVEARLSFYLPPEYTVAGLEGVRCAEVCGVAWDDAGNDVPLIARDDDGDGWMEAEVMLPLGRHRFSIRPRSWPDCEAYYDNPCAEGDWSQPYGDPGVVDGICAEDSAYVYRGSGGNRLSVEATSDGEVIPAGNG